MTEISQTDADSAENSLLERQAISIVQRGNLKTLEQALRRQWRMGQNIVLCWSADDRGVLVILVPHYFLGNYCATEEASNAGNEAFVQQLISGDRRKSRDEMFSIAARLDIAPTFIRLSTRLSEETSVLAAVDQLIRRYGLSYVDDRAVLLFDIVQFSLFTPFEQASQLNSLSYSLNSAYTKLLAQGIEINFARTTTGDGYYIWNRDVGPLANQELFYFMILVVADNKVARAASRGNTVPSIRTAYHIGSHYELYQAEGVNPTVFSYIVGDVTIELARMIDRADEDQILIGDFHTLLPRGPRAALHDVTTQAYVQACNHELQALEGMKVGGRSVVSAHTFLSVDETQKKSVRRFCIVDKHGLSHLAYNLEVSLAREGDSLLLGLAAADLPPTGV